MNRTHLRLVASLFVMAALVVLLVTVVRNADATGETIAGGDPVTGGVNSQIAITDVTINGTGNDIIPVRLHVTAGLIYMTETDGLTFNGPTSGPTLEFSGTRSDVNAALATLHYAHTSVGSQTLEVKLADSNTIYNPDNGHVYQYVPESLTWYAARDAAAGSTYDGLTGYLATITSLSENTFIKDRLNGDAWLGGSDDEAYGGEGVWNWVVGPEAGTNIYNGNGNFGGLPVDGQYTNWAGGEPNQSGNEDCMQTYIASGNWNDLPCDMVLDGYVVEFGDDENGASAIPSKDVTITITAAIFDDGDGSPEDPYVVTDCQRLQNLNQNLSAHYVLTNNIDCTETTSWNGGLGFNPIGGDTEGAFTGVIDGNDYTVDGLQIIRADDDPGTTMYDSPDEQYVGLVGYLNNGEIRDLHVTNAKVKGYLYVGGLAGNIYESTITGSSFNVGTATNSCAPGLCVWARYGEFGGGLVGYSSRSTITDSHTGGPVKGSGRVIGGLVGYAQDTDISHSSSTSPTDGGVSIGGIVGQMEGGSLYRVHASGDVVVNQVEDFKHGTFGGGLVGSLEGASISQSYATGDVSVEVDGGGGLVGVIFSDDSSEITDTYATGNVSGNGQAMGGLIGEFYGGTITRSYASGSVDGSYGVGGLAGIYYNGAVINDSFAAGQVGASGQSAGFAGRLGNDFTPAFTQNYYDLAGTDQEYCTNGYYDDAVTDPDCIGVNDNDDDSLYLMNFANAPFTQSASRVWSESVWYFDGEHHPVLRMGVNNAASIQPEDDDGILTTVENAAPNTGDGNDDGIADSAQENIASFVNPQTDNYVTFEADDNCSLLAISNNAESHNVKADDGYSYPQGMVDYSVNCGTPGYSTDITIYYHGLASAGGMVVRKYDSVAKTYTTLTGASITGSSPVVVSYTITDGSSLDEDGVANGIIVDPVGLATQQVPGAPDSGVGRDPFAKAVPIFIVIVLLNAGAWAIKAMHRLRR